MNAWGRRPNIDIYDNTIIFCKKHSSTGYFASIKKRPEESSSQKLFLLSKSCSFPIFEVIPKNFTITTKNTTCHFNLEMLKEVSPVIQELITKNPDENHYDLNFNDEENVLVKFEQLFQGKEVIIEEDEIPFSQRITKILQIKNCPNYLKPGSLNITEIYSNGSPVNMGWNNRNMLNDYKSGIEIYKKGFIGFLKKEEHQSFIIKTNKNEYKCSIFGIYSSNVIRNILEKDPKTNEFKFDFDDENDEFQSICDLFNFKEIDIKSDNMDFLKEMAENLQIKCILNQVDDYINNYEKFSKQVDEQQTIIDSIDHLFDLLYNINKYGIEKVKISIVQSKWSRKEDDVKELACFILQVVRSTFSLNNEITDLLIGLNNEANESNKLNILLPFIVTFLKTFLDEKKRIQTFMTKNENTNQTNYSKPWEMNTNFAKNSWRMNSFFSGFNNPENKLFFLFIRVLFKRGIISIDEINEILKNYKFTNKYFNAFFLPEIIKLDPKNVHNLLKSSGFLFSKDDNYIDNYITFLKKYLPDKIDLYEKMLDKMEPDDELTKSIRIDDVDTLQSIINRNGIDIENAVVPFNIFDDFSVNQKMLNYTAFCGSVKCFKYLLLNNGIIDESTSYFAVRGGNIEIIKIVDQRAPQNQTNQNQKQNDKKDFFSKKEENYSSDNKIIESTIILHKNELFDWIFENRFVTKGKIGNELLDLAKISVTNGNAHSLIEIVDKGFDITEFPVLLENSTKNGFFKLSKLLISIFEPKLKRGEIDSNNSIDLNNSIDFQSVIAFGNLSIFKLFIQYMNKFNFEQAIVYSIDMEYLQIVDYYFDNLDKIGYKPSQNFVEAAIKASFKMKTDQFFNFLIDKFRKITPEFFTLNFYVELLKNSCFYSNLQATKILTEIILEMNPDMNFSSPFIEASSSGSMDICQYFIDKKLMINYDEFSSQVDRLGSIDYKLFEMIISHVNPNKKFKFLRCINKAIKQKNKNLIEFLLKENAPMKGTLFDAVGTGDIEIVDLILKYNSKPSFINDKVPEGTALHFACNEQNLEIVKRLLSVPGIDPSIVSQENQSPLIIAINNYDMDIVDAILDFYGDNIQSKVWMIVEAYFNLANTIFHNDRFNKSIWKFVIRLSKIESIDPNFYYEQSTFLHKACIMGEYEVVKELLEIDRIDVNKHETHEYDTPLLASISTRKIEIAKLLIKHPKTDLNKKNTNNESALHMAIENNLEDIIKLLINDERFDPVESELDYSFCLADYDISKILISSPFIDVNHVFDSDKTALIHSVEMNDTDKIDLIINHPSFDKDKSDVVGAIFIAAEKNNIDVFRKLIQLINNDFNVSYKNNDNLLCVASRNLSGEIVNEIFSNPNFSPKSNQICEAFVQSYSKWRPGYSMNSWSGNEHGFRNQLRIMPRNQWRNAAFRNQRFNVVQNQPNNNNNNNNNNLLPNKSTEVEIMEMIYDYDINHEKTIDFSKLLPNGNSFFTSYTMFYDTINTTADFLLEHGVDPNKPDKNGIFPLEHAIKKNLLELIKSLINTNKIDYSQLGKENTYLHLAVEWSSDDIFKFLLEQNLFDINAENDNGETPLMLACKFRRKNIISALFEIENLDYLHCDKKGADALRLMKYLNQNEDKEARQSKESYQQKIFSILSNDT